MREVIIASAVRTPIGSFGGSLAGFSAVELGKITAKAAIERAGIDQGLVEEVIVGNVLAAGLGQNIARQIAIKAGLPEKVSAYTVNHVCASGMRAISLAVQMIKAGEAEVVLAGGTESMSNAPYLLNKARFGYRLGNDALVDALVHDGLWDSFNDCHMGITAENVAEKWQILRDEQDRFALESQRRAESAIKAGKFKDEIIPVLIPQKKGDPVQFATDEYPRFGCTGEMLAKLKPAFKQAGTVTAGNASGINDGAAMLLIMSREKAEQLGVQPLAQIIATSSVGVDPAIMGYGPVPACWKALEKADLTMAEIDLIEANEAFAAQSLVVSKELGLDPEKTNVNGGAIALGHPIGASGARITVSLIHEMHKRKASYGLATLCIGGGMGMALIVKGKY